MITAAIAPPAAPDARRLDVYGLALAFQSRVAHLAWARGNANVRDQLSRAALSIVLNIAEGSGRFSPPDKARLYAIARGSACECAAILDVLGGPVELQAELVRIVQMLTRLVASMKARR